jgi:hypothetical protein
MDYWQTNDKHHGMSITPNAPREMKPTSNYANRLRQKAAYVG